MCVGDYVYFFYEGLEAEGIIVGVDTDDGSPMTHYHRGWINTSNPYREYKEK